MGKAPRRPSATSLTPNLAAVIPTFLAALEGRGRSRNTVLAYGVDLRAAATELTQPLDAVSWADIEALLQQRGANGLARWAPSTRNRMRAALNACFKWARREGYVQVNPVELVEAAQVDVTLPRPIPAADLAALDRALPGTPQPFRLVLTILRETGMRANEVLRLEVGDVTLEPGREGLLVRGAKNNTDRSVVLVRSRMPKTLSGLTRHLRSFGERPAPHQPLFRSPRGSAYDYDSLHYHWKRLCARAGLTEEDGAPRHTIHQLRHTVATTLLNEGVARDSVQRVLGHRDPRATQRYAEVSDERLRAELARR